jgi:heat shock protein HslJ
MGRNKNMVHKLRVTSSAVLLIFGVFGFNPSIPMGLAHHHGNNAVGKSMETENAQSFQGKSWKLLEWKEDGKAIALASDRISAKFSDQSMSGSGGCNSYNAEYRKIEGQRYQIRPILSTRMACADTKLNDQERRYFRALMTTQKIMVNTKGQLMLQYQAVDGPEGLLTFKHAK